MTVAGEERTQPPDGLYKLELVDGSISSYVVKLAKGQEAPEYPRKAAQRVQVSPPAPAPRPALHGDTLS